MDIFELIPKGKLWQGKNIRTLFLAIEDGIRRAKSEASKILIECIPTHSRELLADWMRITEAKSVNGMLSTLRASGGNTDDFFLSIAKQFDKDCQILKNNPQAQFMAGMATAGMSLGQNSIPKFTVIFQFSVEKFGDEKEKLLNKLKPAHVRFIYLYKDLKNPPFIAGVSKSGQNLNYYKEIL